MTLTEIIERLEKAEGPDRELDALIWLETTPGATRKATDVKSATGLWPPYTIDETRQADGKLVVVPPVTSSIDAALSLAKRVLPGWAVEHIGQEYSGEIPRISGFGWSVELTDGDTHCQGQAEHLAAALCLATLRALQSKGGAA